MRVVTSSLTIRFYEKDGWHKDILLGCIKPLHQLFGDRYINAPFPGDDLPYWTFAPGSSNVIDFDKLMGYISMLERKFNDYPEENDREFIKKFI